MGSGCNCLNQPRRVTRRVILQKARRHPRMEASTAWKQTISGSVSLPSPGYFSPFPHGTVRYRSLCVSSLGEWSPQLPTRFFVPGSTQELTATGIALPLPGCHGLWRRVPNAFGSCGPVWCASADARYQSFNPASARAAALARRRFGQAPVRSPLLRGSFSVPRAT